MELEVLLDKHKCIGYGSCEKIDPKRFKVVRKKAILLGGSIEGDVHQLEGYFSKADSQKIIDAANRCPVNAITVGDKRSGNLVVGKKIETLYVKEITAKYDDGKEFVLDPAGYFLIRLDRGQQSIEVGFCNEKNRMVLKVVGKTPLEIYQTIINKEKLNIRKDHAAYLGRELQKAYTAIKLGLEYVQDDELSLDKKYKQAGFR